MKNDGKRWNFLERLCISGFMTLPVVIHAFGTALEVETIPEWGLFGDFRKPFWTDSTAELLSVADDS